jgi:hypothetical protein
VTKDNRKVRIGVFTPEKSIFNQFLPKKPKKHLIPLEKTTHGPKQPKDQPKIKKRL